jgi:hypothetical protein
MRGEGIMRAIIFSVLLAFVASIGYAQDKFSNGEYFKTPSGKSIKVTVDQPKVEPEDIFTGHDRAAAKTSFPKGVKPAKEKTLDAFITDLMSKYPDSYMKTKKISKNEDSNRVKEENKIAVVDAYICASKKETDNDFHVILCTDPSKGDQQNFTSEVTGIPKYGNQADDLIIPRNKFKDYFKDRLPGSKYEIYDPPIHVKVTGALFFDVDHPAGAVGPAGHKPKTAWEIHPVIDIEFLD